MWKLSFDELMRIKLHDSRNHVTLGSSIQVLPMQDEILNWFAVLQAGWTWKEDSKKPHALLHSGKHSSGFFLCKKVLKFPNLREIFAACIVRSLYDAGMGKVDGVFGAPYSSITLAADVGRILGVPNYIVEKGLLADDAGKPTMVFKTDDPIPADSVLLRVEELITTTDSCMMATNAVLQQNSYPVQMTPYIGTLIHRPSRLTTYAEDGSKIVAVVQKIVGAWDPNSCPLCAQGSEALAPKGENWAKLVA